VDIMDIIDEIAKTIGQFIGLPDSGGRKNHPKTLEEIKERQRKADEELTLLANERDERDNIALARDKSAATEDRIKRERKRLLKPPDKPKTGPRKKGWFDRMLDE